MDPSIHLGEERSVLVQHSDLLTNLLLLQRRPPKTLMSCGGLISKKVQFFDFELLFFYKLKLLWQRFMLSLHQK